MTELKPQTNRNGILYCALGETFLEQAKLSILSHRRFNQEIPAAVCTNIPTEDRIWDRIIPMEQTKTQHNQYMVDKLVTLLKSPFENTLYLDSDTYIMDDLRELFTLLDKFDLAVCHGHNRHKRYLIQTGKLAYRGKYRAVISKEIPYAFSPVQGGLLLFRGTKEVKEWLNELLRTYQEKEYYDDQVSIRELLWNTSLRFYILPPEYNFNSVEYLKLWKKNNFDEARPKIFHYTKHKKSNIPKLVKRFEKPHV